MVAMETEIAMTGHNDEDVKVDPGLLEKKKVIECINMILCLLFLINLDV